MIKLSLKSEFIFTTCQVGAEPVLKKEFLRDQPGFRFAFSRPGYVTFKSTDGPVPFDFTLESVFARVYGVSFGTIAISDLSKLSEIIQESENANVHLQVWERDLYPPGEEPMGFKAGALLGDLESRIRHLGLNVPAGTPQFGDWVVQVVALDPGKVGIGAFIHSPSHSPWPGGHPGIILPAESPSRAYLKMEEVLLWSDAPVRKGDTAVEIGSAPGGATFALLQRGLKVVGIDPAKMDPRIERHPAFAHVQRPVAQVLREELPDSIQWLVLDMNTDPQIALYSVERLAARMSESLLGVILTIKLNEWKMADEIPNFIEQVEAMGMVRVKAAQLSYHRKEIVIFGLTRLGVKK